MSWARNGLALAPLPHENTPLPWPDRQDMQYLQPADDSLKGHISEVLAGDGQSVLQAQLADVLRGSGHKAEVFSTNRVLELESSYDFLPRRAHFERYQVSSGR
jgi:hypothetical protein